MNVTRTYHAKAWDEYGGRNTCGVVKRKGCSSRKKGETIAVISSDKIEKDIESPGDGFLIETMADINDVVPVGQPIGYIGHENEQVIQGKSRVGFEARAETATAVEVLERPKKRSRRCEVKSEFPLPPKNLQVKRGLM